MFFFRKENTFHLISEEYGHEEIYLLTGPEAAYSEAKWKKGPDQRHRGHARRGDSRQQKRKDGGGSPQEPGGQRHGQMETEPGGAVTIVEQMEKARPRVVLRDWLVSAFKKLPGIGTEVIREDAAEQAAGRVADRPWPPNGGHTAGPPLDPGRHPSGSKTTPPAPPSAP